MRRDDTETVHSDRCGIQMTELNTWKSHVWNQSSGPKEQDSSGAIWLPPHIGRDYFVSTGQAAGAVNLPLSSFNVGPDNSSNNRPIRPSGSTTAVLIDLLQQLTSMLQHNDYVLIASTDFAKGFNSFRHSTLMQKMAVLGLPDNISDWIANYFEQHGHLTKIHDTISAIAFINASTRCFNKN